MATFTVYCDCINYPSICLMQSLGELGNLSLKWGLAGNRQGEILAPPSSVVGSHGEWMWLSNAPKIGAHSHDMLHICVQGQRERHGMWSSSLATCPCLLQ